MNYKARGKEPTIESDVFIAPTAALIGDVEVGSKSSIWFGAVLRGDVMPIKIGQEVNIQDLCMIHGTYNKAATTLHNRVSVGHSCILHGCEVGEATLIGMGSILMDNVKVGRHCLIGAGSLLVEGSEFPEGSLILGRPASVKRALSKEEIEKLEKSADNYLFYTSWYKEGEE